MLSWLGDQFEKGSLFRRLIMIWAMCMAGYALDWTLTFATANANGDQTAFIIASVWTPLNILLGYTIGQYTKSRQ